MPNILITGATGYIGSNIARKLVLDGHQVHIIVRSSSRLDLLSDIKNNLNIHIFDEKTPDLIEILAIIKPYVVFHLAALFIAEHKAGDVDSLIKSNILFGAKLLEACKRTDVKYFINTGTHWQNYNGDGYNPVNLYAATKQAFEDIAKYYTETSQMRMITLKLVDTYGPFDPRPKIMSLLKRIAKSGEALDMSQGEQELGLLYIDDVVKGFMVALEYVKKMPPHEQQSFLLAPSEYYRLKDVAKVFQQVSGHGLNINWGKRAYRNREVMKIMTKETNILKGVKAIKLSEGIKKMLETEAGSINV
jgi:nucleoside-diphosphate-sugar epimerase